MNLILYLSISIRFYYGLFKFRSKCAQYGIYGLNEIYYIGAYISDYLGEGIKLQGNKICREYALYVDYLVKKLSTVAIVTKILIVIFTVL